ncbi:MAG: hypothetical protein HC836_24265 [Richelia sp. RM2_1_2]|nr:hypothetical protein [Richelia sp. RM2_1_2]
MSSPEEIISVIRRFYYSVVGRGNKAVIHYDYLKGFEAGKYSQEYQIMGLFMQELKTLITRECLLPVWTSLQLNRYGIVNNKKSSEIDDSENSFSISDKIVQQSTHSFILRKKTADEIEDEVGLGNCKLIPIKHRHLGQNHEDAEAFVKLPNGRYVKNYIHLRKRGFFFEEIGDLVSTVDQMGDGILVEKNDNKEKDTEL